MAGLYGNQGVAIKYNSETDLLTIPASTDLSTKQYFLVKLAADEQAATPGTKGEKVIGVQLNKPDAENKSTKVQIDGVGVVYAGATISTGNYLVTDAAGEAIQADAAGQHVFGMALHDAVDGDLVHFKFMNLETNAADS
ncbi:MAG: capsid cement protein [bacterium]